MNPILYNLMSSKFRDGFLRLLQCHSLRRHRRRTGGGKFDSGGTRKGTFHTTSTNVSSSHHSSTADRQRRKTIVAAAASATAAVSIDAGGDSGGGGGGRADTLDEAKNWKQNGNENGNEHATMEEPANEIEETHKRFLDLKSKSMSAIDFHVDSYTILSLLKANSLDISCDEYNKDQHEKEEPDVWRPILPIDANGSTAMQHNHQDPADIMEEEQFLVFKKESLV